MRRPVFWKLEKITFRKLDLFWFSCEGREIPTLWSPSERSSTNEPRSYRCGALKFNLLQTLAQHSRSWFQAQSRTMAKLLFVLKVKVILQWTVSWPVCLGVRHPSGTHDQIFSFFKIIFCFIGVRRPLWREVASLVSAVSRASVPRNSWACFIISIF
jgi:hypothetical protein